MKTKNKTIIVLAGPAGIGKTSVAMKLAKKLKGENIRISADTMREMTYPQSGGKKRSDQHIIMAKKIIPCLVKEYFKHGFDNIIIDIAPPVPSDGGGVDKWLSNTLRKRGAYVFLFDAPLKTIFERNKKRAKRSPQGGIKKEMVKKLFIYSQKYIDRNDYDIINTDKIGADKTTEIILNKIKKGENKNFPPFYL